MVGSSSRRKEKERRSGTRTRGGEVDDGRIGSPELTAGAGVTASAVAPWAKWAGQK